MAHKNPLTVYAKTIKAIEQNKRLILLSILFDFLFLFTIAQAQYKLFTPAADAVTQAGTIVQQQLQNLTEAQMMQADTLLMQNPEFVAAYHVLLKYTALFLLVAGLAWLAFKMLAWYFIQKTTSIKINLWQYALRFTLRSLAWAASLILLAGALVKTIQESTPAITIFWTGFVILNYYATCSYARMEQTITKTLKEATKHAKKIVPVYVINTVLIAAALYLPFMTRNMYYGLALIILVTLPVLAITRTSITIASKQATKEKLNKPKRKNK